LPVIWKNLPLRFLYSGILYFIVAALLGVLTSLGFHFKQFHSHLMLAGFVSTTIAGSMYQLVPTVIGTELRMPKIAEASYFLINIGLILLLLSFAGVLPFFASSPAYILGVLLFLISIISTMRSARLKSISIYFFLMATLFYLAGTVYAFLGMIGEIPFRITIHSHMLTAGFVAFTTFGGLYELFPMLSLRKLRSLKLAYLTLLLLTLSMIALLLGFQLSNQNLIVASAIGFASSFYLLALNLFLTLARKPETPSPLDISVKFFLSGLFFGLAGITLPLFNISGFSHTHLLMAGWVTLTIMGAEYHIIPMITWMEKYSTRLGLEEIPMISDLFNLKLANLLLLTSTAGMLFMVVEALRVFGGVILTLTFFTFAIEMFMVQGR